MKTIDTKSLLLGVCLALLFFTLTSGKTSDEVSNIDASAREGRLDVFNRQTMTLYEYYPKISAGVSSKPDKIFKISSDGASIIVE